MSKKIDFYRHLKPKKRIPDPPVLERCLDCGREANPVYGWKDETYCREHAPAHCKSPAKLLETSHAA